MMALGSTNGTLQNMYILEERSKKEEVGEK